MGGKIKVCTTPGGPKPAEGSPPLPLSEIDVVEIAAFDVKVSCPV
jgi:hypothetical protein